jgi:hypothetical protein
VSSSILDASYHYKAEVEIPPGGAEGMIRKADQTG